ncbi:hypothetical protein L6452_16858 [Arctium lappa]|uniref:Uncharacterized protein n=1 Tax=Arctium lappa TaxID=4217 RepID=A0ACB9C1N1_ARCLA|nr:hypothetical protein L6452_16858 [Arctium lappa]
MDFDHENVRSVINEDRLSSLPDELIHHILSCIDSKFAVQTCLLSSRWKLLWTSMPCLNFDSYLFVSLPKFSKFVTHVLSCRNHQIEVTFVKLNFHGAASQFFVRKIANYMFSHNVQELTVVTFPKRHYEFPPCLFSSQSLKRFTLSSYFLAPCLTPKTPWDFPALTSLHLNEITLCDDKSYKSVDLFSKCVNLKNLTLQRFLVKDVEVFDIITPQLSNLTLIKGRNLEVVNLVAPQLENLTVIDCSIKNAIAPPGLSTLSYIGYPRSQLSKEGFHSLNKVTISLHIYFSNMPFKEEDARKTIKLLQEVHSARFLTLNVDIVEPPLLMLEPQFQVQGHDGFAEICGSKNCISSFPDLVSHHPSPFSDLICVNIDSSMRNDAYKVKISNEARNFLLENSPNATFVMELPEAPPTRAMKQKEARAKKKAKLVTEIESCMTELRASIELGKMHIETKERIKAASENLMAELRVVLAKQKMMQIEPERTPIEQVKESSESHNAEMQMQVDQRKVQTESSRPQFEVWKGLVESHKEEIQMLVEQGEVPIDSHKTKMQLEGQEAHIESKQVQVVGLMEQIVACLREMLTLINQESENFASILSKKSRIRLLLENLPKRQRAEIEACYYRLLEESKPVCVGLVSEKASLDTIKDDYEKFRSYSFSTFVELQAQCDRLISDMVSSSTTMQNSSTAYSLEWRPTRISYSAESKSTGIMNFSGLKIMPERRCLSSSGFIPLLMKGTKLSLLEMDLIGFVVEYYLTLPLLRIYRFVWLLNLSRLYLCV